MNTVAVFNDNSKSFEDNSTQSYSAIPHNHLEWALQQPPRVLRLFMECWRSDAFGNVHRGKYQFKQLKTSLKADNLRKAKKALRDAGLFLFEKATQYINGQPIRIETVFNNHTFTPRIVSPPQPQTDNLGKEEKKQVQRRLSVLPKRTVSPPETPKNPPQQDLQDSQLTPQLPTKVVEEETVTQPPIPTEKRKMPKSEIFNFLDLANQGICPPPDAIASILNSEHFQPMAMAVMGHPEWGYKIIAGQLAHLDQESPINAKRCWRKAMLKKLQTIANIGDFPQIELMEECSTDPILKIKLKQLFNSIR